MQLCLHVGLLTIGAGPVSDPVASLSPKWEASGLSGLILLQPDVPGQVGTHRRLSLL